MSAEQGLALRGISLSTVAWWLGVLVGVPLFVVGVVQVGPDLGLGGAALGMTAALLLVLELRPIVASGRYDPQGVTLSTAFSFALLFLWGLWPALIALTVATVASEVGKRKPMSKLLFNVGQFNVSVAAAWGVMAAAGVTPSLAEPLGTLQASDAGWMVGAWAVYFWTNNLLVSAVLSHGGSFRTHLVGDLGYYVWTTFPVLALSPVVVVLAQHAWGMLPLLLIPLVLVYKTASMSRQQEHLAGHDHLTGLPNRASFGTALGAALAAADRSGRPCALFLLDLDRFKEVNDTLGHGAGDQLLGTFATRLRAAVREQDSVARLGGDEFAVILPDTREADAVEVAARVTAALAAPFRLGGHPGALRASIGVSVYPDQARDPDTLLQLADVAMYVAKSAGTGVSVYDARADRFARDRERALRG